ncbi:MAG: metal-sensing transcriptional repressor [Clostridia bacterium]|nr:metal-sensing transcriptional repressor [Clostridia bacterium]
MRHHDAGADGGRPHVHENTKAVVNRLSRAIGHLGAVRTMVLDGRDCSEVLIQLAAVRSALNGVCELILQDHIDHCIVDAVRSGDTEAVENLNEAIRLLLK